MTYKQFLNYGIFLIMCSCNMNHSWDNEVKKIPLSDIFGNPTKVSPALSHDGKIIAYIAPYKNVLNIYLAEVSSDLTLSKERPITFDDNRGIRSFFWAPRSNQILYVQDQNGNENWKLYGVDIKTKTVKCYTPFDNVQVRISSVDKMHKDTIIISMNKDDIHFHDLYKLDLNTGELTLLEKNPGHISGYMVDHDQNPKIAVKHLDDGTSQLLLKKDNNFVAVRDWNAEDSSGSHPIAFCQDTNYVYLIDSKDYNSGRLIKFNLTDCSFEVIAQDEIHDTGSVFIDEDSHEVLAVSFYKDKPEWQILDPEFKKYFNKFKKIDSGQLAILSHDDAKTRWILAFLKDDGPASYYIYDKTLDEAAFLFVNRPELYNYKLSKMEPISFKSQDGLTINGYLSLPVYKPEKKLPLVLLVHGGPATRDSWGYHPEVQWMTNRGYAVLQVNYRGSSGYGKKFLHAGDREWGAKMHDDLIDAIHWAIDKEIAHPNKIAIYGGSYGGYAALVGATFTPDKFCCAVDIVGPSNLITLLNSIPEYWQVARAKLYQKIGHPEKDKEFLESRSPLFKIDNIKIPILIGQGANDPRVKQAESEQIVEAMKNKNIPYEYVLFQDEGHGFAKPENRMKFYEIAEKFLEKHLNN